METDFDVVVTSAHKCAEVIKTDDNCTDEDDDDDVAGVCDAAASTRKLNAAVRIPSNAVLDEVIPNRLLFVFTVTYIHAL